MLSLTADRFATPFERLTANCHVKDGALFFLYMRFIRRLIVVLILNLSS